MPTPTTLWAPETAGALSLRVAMVPPPPRVPMAAIYNEAEADTTLAEVIRGRGVEGERSLGTAEFILRRYTIIGARVAQLGQ